MSLPDKVNDFFLRWNISYNDEQAFILLKARVLHLLDSTLGHFLLSNDDVVYKFAYLVGYSLTPKSKTGDRSHEKFINDVRGKDFAENPVYSLFANVNSRLGIISYLQFLFMAMEEFESISRDYIDTFVKELISTIEITPFFDIRVVYKNKNVVFYPGGAKLLDEELVNKNLLWLEQYPNIRKHFQEALMIYATKDVGKYRNLLDNLRLSVEELLRVILGNRKSLENQKSTLLIWLDEHDVSQQIIDMFSVLLFGKYSLYQNERVKHGEGWSENDIEFMIYLSGVFMRLLIRVNEESLA